ncbi:hypothetical protein AURDEDRAFT_24039, partial [Auricularia subglabra TFB-10046 SS5]
PPRWCRIEEDKAIEWFPLVDPIPEVLPLNTAGRCTCGAVGSLDTPKRLLPCTIFGSHRSYSRTIEVRQCPSCGVNRKFAGPDLRELGLFNFNNRSLYTHELLNSFTSAMTAHELPFHAFATTVERNYVEHGSTSNFVSDETFRRVWYTFRRVQLLGDSFECKDCGPNPSCVIFDGLTAGIPTANLTSTLAPPTRIVPDAPVRHTVR